MKLKENNAVFLIVILSILGEMLMAWMSITPFAYLAVLGLIAMIIGIWKYSG